MDRKRLLILGGGFAGLRLAKKIDTRKYDVTLVDRNNYHSFPPLFYQVASSGLDATDISFPLRRELITGRKGGGRIDFRMGRLCEVDVKAKTVTTDHETIPYDILAIALGTVNNYFGNDKLASQVYTLKSVSEAITLRNELLRCCEMAAITTDMEKRRRMLSIAIVGGGPAGVEIAGALSELKSYIIPKEYPDIDPEMVSVTIIEGMPDLLHTLGPKASAAASKDLARMGVKMRLGLLTKEYDPDTHTLTLSDGSKMTAGIVIWTAGVTTAPFTFKGLSEGTDPYGPGHRLVTDGRCKVKGMDSVYALGDMAFTPPTEAFPKGIPQLAQPAIQQGEYLAKLLNRDEDPAIKDFAYKDKGSMAAIGRLRAVACLRGGVTLDGRIAWVMWMAVHLLSLMGMRSRISTFINWVWAFYTHSASLRMLLAPASVPKSKYKS